MAKFCEVWSSRLCIYMYICCQLGLMRKGSLVQSLQQKLAMRSDQADEAKATTSADKESVRTARA
eukprot:7536144-Heterocapsa_arctica.AAC.1